MIIRIVGDGFNLGFERVDIFVSSQDTLTLQVSGCDIRNYHFTGDNETPRDALVNFENGMKTIIERIPPSKASDAIVVINLDKAVEESKMGAV